MTVKNDIGYNNAPPVFIGNTTLTTTVSQINQNWGSGGPANTYADDFQVKFDGQITSTTTGNIQFYAPADDGVKLYLDNQLVINDWYDKGGGGSVSQPVAFTANTPKAITLYFYENGGGANVQLQWNKGNGWQVVPSTAFSRSSATQAQIDAAIEQGITNKFIKDTIPDNIFTVLKELYPSASTTPKMIYKLLEVLDNPGDQDFENFKTKYIEKINKEWRIFINLKFKKFNKQLKTFKKKNYHLLYNSNPLLKNK